jgi:hypothetical protein
MQKGRITLQNLSRREFFVQLPLSGSLFYLNELNMAVSLAKWLFFY